MSACQQPRGVSADGTSARSPWHTRWACGGPGHRRGHPHTAQGRCGRSSWRQTQLGQQRRRPAPCSGHTVMGSLSLLHRAALMVCRLDESSGERVRPSRLPSRPLISVPSGSEDRPPTKPRQTPNLSPSHPSKSLRCPWQRWTLTARWRDLPAAQEACRRWGTLFLCEGASSLCEAHLAKLPCTSHRGEPRLPSTRHCRSRW